MESDRKSYLSVENLNVSYNNNHVLEDISFQIERGRFVWIVLANVAFLIFAMSLGRMLGRGKLIRPATSQLDRV